MAGMETEAEMNAANVRILMVDDDPGIRDVVSDFLGKHGYEVETAADGREMDQALERGPVDLIVLDVMLPGEDGLAICRRLAGAEDGPPIIMLSAMGEDTDRIVGLEIAADDYLPKPCNPRELLARVRAQLRRQTLPAAEELNLGGLHLHPAERRAAVDGQELRLTGAEFALLLTLAQHAGEVVGKGTLTRLALGREIERFDRSVDVHVSRLRRKLSEASTTAPSIEAVRGAGYLLIAQRT